MGPSPSSLHAPRAGKPRRLPDERYFVSGAIGGRYRVEQTLGRGAMGEVLRAYDLITERDVAIKRFALSADRKDDQLRFRREFHTLAQLKHPRIVEVHDYGVDERSRPYYAMELLDGRDFSELAPLPWRRACGLLRDVASALAFLHARQLLHRDVAPRNVRCTEDGRAKLLDFGMLSTMGVSHEVVGTLPSIPPEMLLGLPMDGRADLFGLGALSFWLLTGRHPQRVHSLEDLMRNGRRPPPPPSSMVGDLPPALDDLVLSLLCPEPLGRPAQAAEVIERLEAIADLPPAPELEAVRGYVRSAALVGREREIELARKRIERMVEGHGGTVLIEGRSGMGKTRLLREIELEAKLAGAVVLHGEGGTNSGPYALVRELARKLERRGRRNESAAHAALVDRLLPAPGPGEGGERAGNRDHREDRAEVQAAFSDWLTAFAGHRPLVLIVDNLQRVDEGSAAVLAGLTHVAPRASLLLVTATRPNEAARADGALEHLRERALVLHTRGLRSDEVRELVRTTFGEVDNHIPFAHWLHAAAGGSPMYCTELMRSLVERGDMRYVAGTWVIPANVETAGVPRELEQAFDGRVRSLEANTLDLGQRLAVFGDEAGLALCVALSPDLTEPEVFAALDGLVREEVIIGAGERYRLRHDGLRDALLRSLGEAERRALERTVGEVLASEDQVSPEREAQIGWHLLRGGDEQRGAVLLGAAGRRLFEATSFEDCVAPLEAALAVFEAADPRHPELPEIYYMLVSAGFYSDRHTNIRHRERTMAVLGKQIGVERARRWARFLGPRLGLITALVFTLLRRLFDRRRMPYVKAFDMYLRSAVYSAGVAGFSFDTAGLRRCNTALSPLMPIVQIFVRTALGLVDNLLAFNLGRLRYLMESSAEYIEGMNRQKRWVNEEERGLTIGGARFQRALVAARVGSPQALDEIEALETLGPRIWKIGALQARTYYHMWRGESAAAQRAWSQAELEFVRLGALWQLYAIHHSSAAITYAFTDDVLGLRRCIEALTQQQESGLGFGVYLRLAQAEYARLRGETDEALSLIEDALAELPEGEGLPRPWALTARADALRGAGRLDEAWEAGTKALAHCEDPEYGQSSFRCRAQWGLAWVEALRGEPEAAAKRLDQLILDAGPIDNPFILGAAHEARAEISARLDDPARARLHATEVEHCFVPTRNPVLIARYERLMRTLGAGPETTAEGLSNNDIATAVFDPATIEDTVGTALSRLSACHDAAERAEQTLSILRASAGALDGFLYLLTNGRPTLVAPSAGREPPPAVVELAKRRLGPMDDADEDHLTVEAPRSGWASAVLYADSDGQEHRVGVVVIELEQPESRLPPASLRRALGQRLYEEGDVGFVGEHTD
ncbi:MAG: AAA family ATPase [Myxococcota bacterium]